MDKSATAGEIRGALHREANAHRIEKTKLAGVKRKLATVYRHLNSATVLLMQDSKYREETETDKQRRVALVDVCGQGWADLDGRYFRKKKATAMAFVREQCGDDVLKQIQLCEGLMKQFAVQDPASSCEVLLRGLPKKEKREARKKLEALQRKDDERALMVDTVMSGIANFYDQLKMEHEGRYSHEARVAQQVLSAAVMSTATAGMATLIGALVHCDRHVLSKGMKRSEANHEARKKNETPVWYDEEETSVGAYPEEYRLFLHGQWLLNSRASENQNDECKSPCINPATGDTCPP